MSFRGLIAHFLLVLSNIALSGWHVLKDILGASRFGQLWIKCYKHPCAGFCVDMSFPSFWVNTRSTTAGSYGTSMFSFLQHFALPPAITESSCCPTSSPAFGGVSVLDLGPANRCVVAARGFNLHFPDDIWCWASFHVLIYLPSVYLLWWGIC